MSTTKRLIHGNIAAWFRLGVTLLTQIALVPLFLTHWDKETLGIWMGVQAVTTLITIPDFGFQEFLQNEFLRLGADRKESRRLLWSTLPTGLAVGFTEIVVVLGGLMFGLHQTLLGVPESMRERLNTPIIVTLMSYLVATWIFGSVTGIASRALSAYGHYARMSWWNSLSALIQTLLPAVVVLAGGDLLRAGVAQCLAIVLCGIPQCVDMFRLLKKEDLGMGGTDLRYGFAVLGKSQALTLRALIDRTRQQGIRLIIAPMLGAAELANFTTTRTGANVAYQGLGTITGPMMPELMRFLHKRDQAKVEISFGTVWLVVLAFMAPATIVLQAVGPAVFHAWTRGKIAFDPASFGMLSLSVLVIAAAQPAGSIAKGNNLLGIQLIMSLSATIVAILLTLVLVPKFGIVGTAVGILAAEIVVGFISVHNAQQWMRAHDLRWPWESFTRVLASVVSSGLFVAACSLFPRLAYPIALVGVIAQGIIVAAYWRSLPADARVKAAQIVEKRLPKTVGLRLGRMLR